MENIDKGGLSKSLIKIGKGSIIAIFISLILLFIFAAVLTYTNINESTINPVIIVISGISILIGSSVSTLKIRKNGLINGGAVGLIYILTIYILSSITGIGFNLNIYSVIMCIISVIAGMIGGIIGVNLK